MRKIDHHHCSGVPCDICGPDPRDAEIARLKAELEAERFDTRILHRDLAAHKRALAAGPAALRRAGSALAAGRVEAAQEAAMKEKP